MSEPEIIPSDLTLPSEMKAFMRGYLAGFSEGQRMTIQAFRQPKKPKPIKGLEWTLPKGGLMRPCASEVPIIPPIDLYEAPKQNPDF